jgi:hypothetical protein
MHEEVEIDGVCDAGIDACACFAVGVSALRGKGFGLEAGAVELSDDDGGDFRLGRVFVCEVLRADEIDRSFFVLLDFSPADGVVLTGSCLA